MNDSEFDNLKKGDLIFSNGPEDIWIVVIDDPISPIAVRGTEMVKATRLINPKNWSLLTPGDAKLEQRILDLCKEPKDPKTLHTFHDKFGADKKRINEMVRNLVDQGKLTITIDRKVKTVKN